MGGIDGKADVADRAVELFRGGLYCSEAILRAFDEDESLGMPEEFFRIGTGFGAGMGAAKCSCGSVTGAQMVLSLRLGRLSAEESVDDAFAAASELHDRFREQFGRVCCRVLTRTVEWGSAEHHVLCEDYVRAATEIAYEISAQRKAASVLT